MTQQTQIEQHVLQAYGPLHRLALARFTPNGTNPPTMGESHGCDLQVTRSSAGVYVVTFSSPVVKDICVLECSGVPGDANYHQLSYAVSQANRTVTVTHSTCTFASIASGPAASDTSGEITVMIYGRMAS